MATRGKRRATSKVDPEEARRRQEEKLQKLHEQLRAGVERIVTGDDWRAWLDTAARFHQYSANNVFLILIQRPAASRVAGYSTWHQLGRQVRKGEKGIGILAPVIKRVPVSEQEHDDTVRTASQRDKDTKYVRRMVGVRSAYVFDISQTDGDALPARPSPQLLAGSAPDGVWDKLHAFAVQRGWSVNRRGVDGGSNGYTDFSERAIVVRDDVDPAQAVKTLAHELGHALLHDGGSYTHRGLAEVEAESVAYLVMQSHGLDTSDYSFPYVAGWGTVGGGADPADRVRECASRVLDAARTVLEATRAEQVAPERLAAQEHRADSQLAALRGIGGRAELSEQLAKTTPPGKASRAEYVSNEPELFTSPSQLDRYEAANRAALDFYRQQLERSDAAASYLRDDRGLTDIPEGFAIGYAPATWTGVLDHLRSQGFSDADLLDAGLVRKTSRGTLIDVFRDRIVIAQHDLDGRVAGFVGRPPHNNFDPGQTPKYLNTAATTLYDKGRLLFGLHEQHRQLASGAVPVLVEGPFDVLAVAQADGGRGRVAAVGSSGTAVTPEHLASLARTATADRVVLAGDGDPAGQQAMLRTAELAARLPKPVYAAVLPTGYDPADWARQHPGSALAPYLDETLLRPAVQLVVDARIDSFGDRLQWVDGRVDAMRYAASALAGMPLDAVSVGGARIAQRLDLDPRHVGDAIAEAFKSSQDTVQRLADRAAMLADIDEPGRQSSQAVRLAELAHPTPARTGGKSRVQGRTAGLSVPAPRAHEALERD